MNSFVYIHRVVQRSYDLILEHFCPPTKKPGPPVSPLSLQPHQQQSTHQHMHLPRRVFTPGLCHPALSPGPTRFIACVSASLLCVAEEYSITCISLLTYGGWTFGWFPPCEHYRRCSRTGAFVSRFSPYMPGVRRLGPVETTSLLRTHPPFPQHCSLSQPHQPRAGPQSPHASRTYVCL